MEKYQDLKWEVARLWDIRKVLVIPVVVGAPGFVKLSKWIEGG